MEDLLYIFSSIPSRVRALHNAGTECNLTERNSDFVSKHLKLKSVPCRTLIKQIFEKIETVPSRGAEIIGHKKMCAAATT